jgi:hypothetical protein
MLVTIKDDTLSGQTKHQLDLHIQEDSCTVKEIIRKRIFQEVENYNNKLPEYFNSLVQPTDAEYTLNGYRLREKRKIDPEQQYYLALEAFMKNGFFMLINDQQIDDPEAKIELTDNMVISFIKLTPLVGG